MDTRSSRIANVFQIRRPNRQKKVPVVQEPEDEEEKMADKERMFARNSSHRSSTSSRRSNRYKRGKVKRIAEDYEKRTQQAEPLEKEKTSSKLSRRKQIRSFAEAETEEEKEAYRRSLVEELDAELANMMTDGFLDEHGNEICSASGKSRNFGHSASLSRQTSVESTRSTSHHQVDSASGKKYSASITRQRSVESTRSASHRNFETVPDSASTRWRRQNSIKSSDADSASSSPGSFRYFDDSASISEIVESASASPLHFRRFLGSASLITEFESVESSQGSKGSASDLKGNSDSASIGPGRFRTYRDSASTITETESVESSPRRLRGFDDPTNSASGDKSEGIANSDSASIIPRTFRTYQDSAATITETQSIETSHRRLRRFDDPTNSASGDKSEAVGNSDSASISPGRFRTYQESSSSVASSSRRLRRFDEITNSVSGDEYEVVGSAHSASISPGRFRTYQDPTSVISETESVESSPRPFRKFVGFTDSKPEVGEYPDSAAGRFRKYKDSASAIAEFFASAPNYLRPGPDNSASSSPRCLEGSAADGTFCSAADVRHEAPGAGGGFGSSKYAADSSNVRLEERAAAERFGRFKGLSADGTFGSATDLRRKAPGAGGGFESSNTFGSATDVRHEAPGAGGAFGSSKGTVDPSASDLRLEEGGAAERFRRFKRLGADGTFGSAADVRHEAPSAGRGFGSSKYAADPSASEVGLEEEGAAERFGRFKRLGADGTFGTASGIQHEEPSATGGFGSPKGTADPSASDVRLGAPGRVGRFGRFKGISADGTFRSASDVGLEERVTAGRSHRFRGEADVTASAQKPEAATLSFEDFTESLGDELEDGAFFVEAYNDEGRELVVAQLSVDRKVIDIDSELSIRRAMRESELVFYEEPEYAEVFYHHVEGSGSNSSLDEVYEDPVYNNVRRETFCDEKGVVRIERVGYPEKFKERDAPDGVSLERNDSLASTKKLHYIVDELRTTERKYVEDLEKVVKRYIPYIERNAPTHLRASAEKVAGNIAKIHRKQRKFLEALERSEDDTDRIAACFVDHEYLFDLYPNYLKNKPRADASIKELGVVIKRMQEKYHEKLDFSAYLLTPLQRLGKYILFLEKIEKELGKLGVDSAKVRRSLRLVRAVMARGNDCVAIESIENSPISKMDYGGFIMREKFAVLKPRRLECVVFLFTDVVVFTFAEQKNVELFNYVDSIKMHHLRIATFEDGTIHLTDFPKAKRKLNSSRHTYVLENKSAKVRDTWREAIEKLLWQQLFREKEHVRRLGTNNNDGGGTANRPKRSGSSGSAVFYVD